MLEKQEGASFRWRSVSGGGLIVLQPFKTTAKEVVEVEEQDDSAAERERERENEVISFHIEMYDFLNR
jgi:hypothetical protein